MSVLMVSILQITYAQTVPLGGELASVKITYPLENSVMQFDETTQKASVPIAGQVLTGTKYTESLLSNQFYLRIQKYDYSTGGWTFIVTQGISFKNCTNCGTPDYSKPKTFYANSNPTMNNLDKGWYRVAVFRRDLCYEPSNNTFTPTGIYTMLSNWRKFGVGDVFYIAGQSNASGTRRTDDKTLAFYESQSEYGDGFSFPLIELPDAQIPEGSIVNRIRTNNRQPLNGPYPVKGLPIFPGDSVIGFKKFVSGKPVNFGEMGMAPNGIDSWAWARFGQLRVNRVGSEKYPVLLFNTAIEGSSMADWKNTHFNNHLKKLMQINANAFGVRGVLWQQGEAETLLMRGVGGSQSAYSLDYSTELNSLISQSRSTIGGKNISWFISKTAYATGTVPSLADNRVLDFDLQIPSSGTWKEYKANTAGDPGVNTLIAEQNSVINPSARIYSGPVTDDISKDYRTSYKRIHFDGYQGKQITGKNGLQLLAEKWNTAIDANGNTPSVPATAPLETNVVYDNYTNTYSLKVKDPSAGSGVYKTSSDGIFKWVYDDNSPFDTPNVVGSASAFPLPSLSQSKFVTCYFRANENSAFSVSVPYYNKPTCNGCRVGGNVTALTRGKTIGAGGGSVLSDISNFQDGTNFFFDGCLPSWLSVSKNSETNDYVFTAGANTSGNLRNGTVNIRSVDQNGIFSDVQTITISQANQSNGCTNSNLSNLTAFSVNQDWSTPKNNQNVLGGPLKIGGTTYPHGIGTHANSNIKYNIAGMGYVTFTGAMGRDDSGDPCNFGTQNVQFQIKADGQLLKTSLFHNPTSNAETFSVDVTNKSTLELITLDAGDQIWGDQADWVNTVLTCGSGCNVTPPTDPTASINPITSGQSTTLSSSCPNGTTIKWSTNQSGTNSIQVNPTVTTAYNVYCDANNGCTSSSKSITITVGTPPSCTNSYLGNTWTYAYAEWGGSPKIDTDIDGGPIQINGTSYSKGIGTHAYSEIIYDLGLNHPFQTFKADVGRDQDAYTCGCGTQDMVFKVLNNATNAVLAGPVTKGNYQSATALNVNISNVRYLKLQVDIGSDGHNWGDQANWANARLVCPNSNRIGSINPLLEEEQENTDLKIIPNPVNDIFKLELNLSEKSLIEIEIYNSIGKLIKSKSEEGNIGLNTFSMNSDGLIPGQYLVKLFNGVFVKTKKIIVE